MQEPKSVFWRVVNMVTLIYALIITFVYSDMPLKAIDTSGAALHQDICLIVRLLLNVFGHMAMQN